MEQISDNEQEELYDKAEKQWKKHKHNPNYTEAEHREWVADKNEGVSHVGVNPSLLPRSSIRPNVFHLGCAIGKGSITYLRSFAIRQSQVFQNKLVKLLATFLAGRGYIYGN